ncbi:hypothetical protein LXD99_20815, partial [Yersinia enterocolitica]|nr:hypothetical protein [Yersinia enterocolitica]
HPHWCGLTLLAVDGVVWRTPDTPENDTAFPRQTYAGHREIKQTMQLSRLTLRSKKPELVEQELWGVLLGYNLVRYQMI